MKDGVEVRVGGMMGMMVVMVRVNMGNVVNGGFDEIFNV